MIIILILIICAVLSYILYRRVEKKNICMGWNALSVAFVYYVFLEYACVIYDVYFNNADACDNAVRYLNNGEKPPVDYRCL